MSDHLSKLSIYLLELNFLSFKTSISVLNIFPHFHQSDKIPCHQSYLSDLFYHIPFRYYIYLFWNTMLPVSKLLYHQLIYLHHFNLSDFFHQIHSRQSYIYPISFIILFVNILHVSLGYHIY